MTGKVLCIIPAKGRSNRLPRKNIMNLCGKPMLAYTIEAAKHCGIFDKIIVSSEDNEVLEIAKEYGAIAYRRRNELSEESANIVDVSLDVADALEKEGNKYDTMAILLATSPLRNSEDIKMAYEKFVSQKADFLMAVTDYIIPPFWALHEVDGYLKSFFGKQYMVKSQKLPKVCVGNGAIYLVKTDSLKREKTLHGKKLIGYHMPVERSIDVDEPSDFIIAESLMQRILKGDPLKI